MEWAEWVPFWRVRMWDGDRVVLCGGLCWPGWARMVQRDQMKSGQDELWSWRAVGVLDQKKVGNKIDLILA